jgi:DNA repair protein SbcD/Mre11
LRIIHTSDIHLNSGRKESLEALQDVLAKAGEERADLLVIGGDMFDSNEEADILRPGLRKMLSSLPFTIMVIPGNHDMDAYRADMNFGDSIKVLNRHPFEVIDFEEVRITAVPYANQAFNDLAGPLRGSINEKKINILVIHCTLDMPYLADDGYGDEKKQAYLPVNSKILGNIGFDYVFAGHFHSRTVENRLSEKTLFLYPGSPVSVSRKEKGRRTAVLLDTEGPSSERIRFLPLDSFYYEDIEIDFSPEMEAEILKELEKTLKKYSGHRVNIYINMGGFISSGEKEMAGIIKKLVEKNIGKNMAIEVVEQYRDISSVLEDPLYGAFKERLKRAGLEEGFEKEMEEMVISQFSKIKAR